MVMMLVLGVALGVLAAVAAIRWERRPPKPKPYVRRGECCAPGCGLEVAGDDLHVIASRGHDDGDIGMDVSGGAGTGVSAEFCAEHCPGGCLNPRHA